MAYVLSLPTRSPWEQAFLEPPCLRSRVSILSQISTETIQHSPQRRQSLSWPLTDDSTRLASSTVLNYIYNFNLSPKRPRTGSTLSTLRDLTFSGVENRENNNNSSRDSIDKPVDEFQKSTTPLPSPEGATCEKERDLASEPFQYTLSGSHEQPVIQSPFKRWLSTLRRRHSLGTFMPDRDPWLDRTSTSRLGHHKASSFSSSIGFLTAVKSANLTLAGTSIAPTSKHGRKPHVNSDNTSISCHGPRASVESNTGSIEPTLDGQAWFRSIQRRNIVDEILSSEESYISDMKAMIHIYFTLLASAPPVSLRRKEMIQKSLSQIIQLHEDLLGELQRVVPSRAESTQRLTLQHQTDESRHTRWHSFDNGQKSGQIPEFRHRFQRSVDLSRSPSPIARSMVMTTNTVHDVAKVFDRFARRFLAYEAYVAHHGIIQEEANITSKFIPSWTAYERGVEALNVSTTSIEHKDACSRKGLTLSDLGIKPIQRICKYPLFFAELCKHTPACDDPIVHAELEKVLSRLQETAEEINYAMDNPQMRHLTESSWLLQDRLVFREGVQLSNFSK
ncbi:uncharacterized protein PV09_00852 [Verruconis gallopava]|uniref:DH domain-containing protein n=1 Tax=Verruconis gallopava TaxID=253628 RepID=A0A0D1Y1J2_9PEZI|nr:uncharacterized protein PV09_00852 [Verruconis gallopava]KIW08936.1 hypothetical protein PV09_00852 [Verruconis gallopava]